MHLVATATPTTQALTFGAVQPTGKWTQAAEERYIKEGPGLPVAYRHQHIQDATDTISFGSGAGKGFQSSPVQTHSANRLSYLA